MCDINAIKQIAERYSLIVVEDTALALGAKLDGKYAGTIGDFGYYSTDRSKVINTGLGGIVSLNNEKYLVSFNNFYKDVPHLTESFTKKIAITFILNLITLHPSFYWFGKFVNVVLAKFKVLTYLLDEPFTEKNDIVQYPYPSKLSNVFAKIGLSQIYSLEKNLQNRKEIAKYYNSILHVYTEEYIENEKNIFLRYSFLIKNRDYWENKFSSKIELGIWFKTIASGRSDNFEEIGYFPDQNEISEYVCKHIFNLPTHNRIKPKKLEKLLYDLKNSGDIIEKDKIL
jgi:dTDP-4-amino-4,6-dideoxygalactose transaminase